MSRYLDRAKTLRATVTPHVIPVIKDGRIIEQGDHDALMAKGGFYSELYNAQFGA